MKINIFGASILPILLLFLLSESGCKNDDNNMQIVNINLNGVVDTQPFQFLTDYVSPVGQRYNFTKCVFYLSNIYLLRADGTKELVKDVELFDFKTPTVISGEVPRDNYTSIQIGLGLDSLQNAQNPADFAPEHPLSYSRAPYWGWASKYIFAQFEGKTAANAVDTPSEVFLYHTGLDSLYHIINVPKNIAVGDNETDITLTMQFDKLFNSTHTINIFAEPISQTLDNYDLASRVADNFSTCFE